MLKERHQIASPKLNKLGARCLYSQGKILNVTVLRFIFLSTIGLYLSCFIYEPILGYLRLTPYLVIYKVQGTKYTHLKLLSMENIDRALCPCLTPAAPIQFDVLYTDSYDARESRRHSEANLQVFYQCCYH